MKKVWLSFLIVCNLQISISLDAPAFIEPEWAKVAHWKAPARPA